MPSFKRSLVVEQFQGNYLKYSPPSIERRVKRKKSIIFQSVVTDKVVFGAIYSTLCTKTIILLGVGESGGYSPRLFAARQIVTIHLLLSE